MTQADPVSAEHPLVGQTIANKYKVVRLLGEGGMGCVYHAEQQLGTTVRKVAIKTLHTHLSHDASVKARFNREVGTVAGLEHPNTIQVYDFGEMPDGTLYIVMEFVQGKSVADTLEKEGPMPPERVENILRQVVGSLEEAHGQGIVHRDLKPDNVVLAERAGQKDWVEVLDFGIAKRSSEHDPNEAKLTQQGMVLGTPPYMSPEQFTGQPIDVRSDIYALGVMAYEMLSGKLPWEANTAWEWASKHMTEAPTPLERQPLGAHIPQRMRDAVARALAKDKNQRWSTVREFFNAFSGGDAPAPAVGGPAAGIAITPGAHGTSVVNVAPGQPHPITGPQPMNGPSARMQTEMGAPAMNPMSMGPGMGGPGMGAPPMNQGGYGPPPAIAQPNMVTAGSQPEKKNNTLIFVLGGLAAVLLIGAGIAAVASGHKIPTTTGNGLDLPTAAPAPAPVTAPADSVATTVTSAAPLTAPAPVVVPHTAPAPKPATAPSTKPAPKPDPAECVEARKAHGNKGANAKVLEQLDAKCKAAGGSL